MKTLHVLLAVLLCLALAPLAFAGGTQEPQGQTEAARATTSAEAAKYKEAPMLASMVAAGKLPPVEQRLPDQPLVVKPRESIGKYGGELRNAVTGMNYVGSFVNARYVDKEPYTWTADGGKLLPNWVAETSFIEGGKVVTIKLLKGIKWSDGTLVNSEDLRFTYEDYAFNKELSPGGAPSFLKEIERFEIVDDITFRYRFKVPNPLFQYQFIIAKFGPDSLNLIPSHYMKQFHPKYADKAKIETLAKQAGFETWTQYFDNRLSLYNADRPVLQMYKVREESPDVVVFERNPYYWKVDTAGNQLPYIDTVRYSIVTSAEVVTLKGMAGELDFVLFHLSLGDYPTLKKNEAAGGYRVMLWDGSVADTILWTNHNYKGKPALGELLRTPKFKQALSVAIDRDEINELTYAGTAKAIALSPPEGSGAYEERFARMWAEYNPDQAKRMLDKLGVVDNNGDGMREMPNGEKLVIEVMVPTNWQEHPATAELIQSYWAAIGVQMTIKNIPYPNIVEFVNASDFEAAMWKESIITHPMNFLRRGFKNAFVDHDFALLWALYMDSGGARGEKPSDQFAEGYNLLAKALSETDEAKRDQLLKQVWENYYANLWTIGINQQVPSPVIVSKALKNVPENALSGYDMRTPTNAECFLWYFDR